jgi:hypothetical protein
MLSKFKCDQLRKSSNSYLQRKEAKFECHGIMWLKPIEPKGQLQHPGRHGDDETDN